LLPVMRGAPTLALRMWVDNPEFGARPQLTSSRQEWWVRELSTRALAWTLFISAVMCAPAGLTWGDEWDMPRSTYLDERVTQIAFEPELPPLLVHFSRPH
jgi:hypothetical protein